MKKISVIILMLSIILGTLSCPIGAQDSGDPSLSEAETFMIKKPIPDKTVVLTFDDALMSHLTNVAPVLKEHGFDATFYISELYFEHYGAKNYADGVNKGIYLSWEQIKLLSDMGFEIGNHSLTHQTMTALSDSQMHTEADGIAERCAEYGIPTPTTFGYPGLTYSAKIIDYLTSKGYTFARTGLADTYNPLKQHPMKIMACDAHLDYDKFVEQVNKAKDGEIVVLLYHDVPNKQSFERTMKYLADNNFNVLSMERLSEYIDPKYAAKYFEDNPTALLPDVTYTEGKTEFSFPEDFDLSTQGKEGFYYMYKNSKKLNYAESVGGFWGGEEAFCRIAQSYWHPGNSENPVLCWKAPNNGAVSISVTIDKMGEGSNGVNLTVSSSSSNGKLAKLTASNSRGAHEDISTFVVSKGSKIYFELDANGNNGSDSTNVNIKITFYGASVCAAIDDGDNVLIDFGNPIQLEGDAITLEGADGSAFTPSGVSATGNFISIPKDQITEGTKIKYTPKNGASITSGDVEVAPFEFKLVGAPQGLAASAPSASQAFDGNVFGTSAEMEYRQEGDKYYTYESCPGDKITNLYSGTIIYVRYATGEGELGIDTKVTVPPYTPSDTDSGTQDTTPNDSDNSSSDNPSSDNSSSDNSSSDTAPNGTNSQRNKKWIVPTVIGALVAVAAAAGITSAIIKKKKK